MAVGSRAAPIAFCDQVTLRGNRLQMNSAPTSDQFKNTKFVLPPLGKSQLETALPGITAANGNSYERMPPGEAYRLRHADIIYDAGKVAAYDACLNGLLADGILDKIDVLEVLTAPFRATSLQNLVQRRYDGSVSGTLAFTPGIGMSGATATDFVELAFNPTTASAPSFTQNSAFMALWRGGDSGVGYRCGSSNSRVSANVPGNIDWRPNAASAVSAVAPANFEMAWWTRPDATKFTYGYDGTTVSADAALASAALTASNLRIGATGGTTSAAPGIHRAFVAGGYLTVTEKEMLRGRVNALLAALAA